MACLLRIPGRTYGAVLLDPPWAERGGGRIVRGAQRHYPLMSAERIVEVVAAAPCWRPAPRCHVWLWATSNHLRDALGVMEALGFRHVTDWVWVKDRIGLGQYRRSRHEWLLFGTRGDARVPDVAWPDSVIEEPRREHSRKPDGQYAIIEHVSRGPWLEMFARGPGRPGWDVWGEKAESWART